MKDKAYLLRSRDEIIAVAISRETAQRWSLEGEESEKRAYKEIPVVHSCDLTWDDLK